MIVHMSNDFRRVIGLKVDVDTYDGMRKGVPALLSLLRKHGIRASFFVPMGKDHTGWTAKRVFTRKGFLKKAGRVGVLETYGFKTLMYGLLLPGPEIARKTAPILKQIVAEGHEAGIHGYDHVHWHDHIKAWERGKTEEVLQKASAVYEDIFGKKPRSFAAPGWMVNQHALRFFKNNGFAYTSDTRGLSPFFPEMGGEGFDILQIPTTLPTLDEVVGIAGADATSLSRFFFNSLKDGLNILTVHTELEGHRWVGFLDSLIRISLERGFVFERLIDIASRYRNQGAVPRSRITYGYVEGRAGEVSCQEN
ncbi:MAG: putative 4-deoxy-4-formamido-L-arabinose-phosphoundecaprenol deformylase ArnD [Syntrophorhabdus sp. PtaU1.Bin050]|nr:MAG: putative 4-deoxy-4-formamido-L-arabinose-phosphoundecaprenol deformylase ArnD [Syntrophorhabdus sp. PtaU1.Bin050]